MSTPKEPHCFEDEYERGAGFYWRTYCAAGWAGQPLIGDARAAHLHLHCVPRRIYDTVPNARLVAILRNPVERAFSHWWMQRRHGREPLGFDLALRENRQAIGNGDSCEGERAALETMRRLYEFLGLDRELPRNWLRRHYEPHNRRLEALVGRDLADSDR